MTVRFHLMRSLAIASLAIAVLTYSPHKVLAQDQAQPNNAQQNQTPANNQRQQQTPEARQQSSEQTTRARQTNKAPHERADDESPALGILTGACPGKAVCVKGTIPYSPADEAGIEPGDYILSVDGKEVTSPAALKQVIAAVNPDAQVTLKVWRQGEEMDRKVQLASKAEQLPKSHDAWLGVMLASDDKGSIKIDHIVPGSPAANSELEEGDVLVKVKNESIKDAQGFIEKIEEMGPGDELQITVRRDGQDQQVAVELGSFGDAPMAFLRQLQSHHENSFHGGEPHSGANSMQLIDRALDDMRQQIRSLRTEIRELKGDKGIKPADAKKSDVSSVARPNGTKLVSQIQLQRNIRPYFNNGYIPYRSNYYGQYNGYNQGYNYRYGNNYSNPYGNSYYYRYGGRPYYYGGNSNWYGNRPRSGIQVAPNLGLYWY